MPLPTQEEIESIVHRMTTIGIPQGMREDEEAKGHKVIMPGDVPWFFKEDWLEDCVVSLDGSKVRIILVIAKNQGNGSFSRLTAEIIKAGLLPVVIAPIGQIMPSILERWGWRERVVGSNFSDTENQWFPMRKWKQQRILMAGVKKGDGDE